MTEAFDLVCRALKERELENISIQAIALKIAALAHAGETDVKQLVDQILSALPEKLGP
jgi:hypothetical protein